MGKRIHLLSNINEEVRTADCMTCGPVSISRSGPVGWRCRIAINERKRISGRGPKTPIPRPENCQICDEEKPLVRDHDHNCCDTTFRKSCGKCFRGWICQDCNLGLARFKDDQALLKKATDYLSKK